MRSASCCDCGSCIMVAKVLDHDPNAPWALHDLCHACAKRSSFMSGVRIALIADTAKQLCEDISDLEVPLTAQVLDDRSLEFYFPELEAWKGMAQQLYDTNWLFQDVMNRCSSQLEERLHVSLVDVLYGKSPLSPETAGAAAAMVQLSLACLLQSWGLRPRRLFGLGRGELVAQIAQGESIFTLLTGPHETLLQSSVPHDARTVVTGSVKLKLLLAGLFPWPHVKLLKALQCLFGDRRVDVPRLSSVSTQTVVLQYLTGCGPSPRVIFFYVPTLCALTI